CSDHQRYAVDCVHRQSANLRRGALMQTFKDAQGRIHRLEINAATAILVRATLKVDLFRAYDDGAKVLRALAEDPATWVMVIYLLCGGQPGDGTSTAEVDFCRAIDGDTLERMTAAFQEELINFSRPRSRKLLRELHEKLDKTRSMLEEKARRKIEAYQ